MSFEADYFAAVEGFRSAATKSGAVINSQVYPAAGPDDRPLSVDVARIGNAGTDKILLHLSGVHGVEGFTGSAIQTAILREAFELPNNLAVLLVHAVNPYGFAWLTHVI